jgi:hypothetical protein
VESKTKPLRPITGFLIGFVPIVLVLGSTWAEAGPYAWVATVQLKWFGSYGEKATFMLAFILWIVIGVVAAMLYQRFQGAPDPQPPPQGEAPTAGPDGAYWVLPGAFSAGLALVLIGTLWLVRPPAPQTLASLRELPAAAQFRPTRVSVSLEGTSDLLDDEHSAALKQGREITLFAPVHAKGAKAVEAICAGKPEAWKNLGTEASGVLTLEPVPLIVRRVYADADLDIPLFRPILRLGGGIGDLATPWIIAGLVLSGISGYLWRSSRK